jgi:hypothetical protein
MSRIIPQPKQLSNFSHSTVPANPKTSQVKLRGLTFSDLYIFTIATEMEQGVTILYEELQIGRYISKDIVFEIQAYDLSHNITGMMRVSSNCIIMSNEALYHLLFIKCAPKSTIEFRLALVTNTTFATPPHGYIPITSNWKWAYQAYLIFFQNFEEVYANLTQNEDDQSPYPSLSPDFKSKPGNIGLMQIMNELPPNNVGIRLAGIMSAKAVKECKTIHDYLKLLKPVNEYFFQQSKQLRLDEMRFQGATNKTLQDIMDSGKKPAAIQNASPSSTTMTPYSNPHKNVHDDNHILHNLHGDVSNMRHSDIHYNPYQNNDYNIHDDNYDPVVDNKPSFSLLSTTGS